jgi:hypothetical protein
MPAYHVEVRPNAPGLAPQGGRDHVLHVQQCRASKGGSALNAFSPWCASNTAIVAGRALLHPTESGMTRA